MSGRADFGGLAVVVEGVAGWVPAFAAGQGYVGRGGEEEYEGLVCRFGSFLFVCLFVCLID